MDMLMNRSLARHALLPATAEELHYWRALGLLACCEPGAGARWLWVDGAVPTPGLAWAGGRDVEHLQRFLLGHSSRRD